jgi:hypothetical protein
MHISLSCFQAPRCQHQHSVPVKLNLYADQMSVAVGVVDAAAGVAAEVVEVSMIAVVMIICVAIIKTEDEVATTMEAGETTTTEEVVEVTTETKVAMVHHKTSHRPSQTHGHPHLVVQTSSLPHHQAGYRLHSREAIRAMEATAVLLECHLRSARPGWATRLLIMAAHHRNKPATTARLGTSSTTALPMRS